MAKMPLAEDNDVVKAVPARGRGLDLGDRY
jgi:hypothetical protein